jgi:hypothetical protein
MPPNMAACRRHCQRRQQEPNEISCTAQFTTRFAIPTSMRTTSSITNEGCRGRSCSGTNTGAPSAAPPCATSFSSSRIRDRNKPKCAVFSMHYATPEDKGPAEVTFLLNFFDELRRREPVGK